MDKPLNFRDRALANIFMEYAQRDPEKAFEFLLTIQKIQESVSHGVVERLTAANGGIDA